MKTICLAHSKGGVGKSTLAWSLANFIRTVLGKSVGVVDLDLNQVVTNLNDIRERNGLVGFDMVSPDFKSDIDAFLEKKFDFIIADVGGYDSDLVRYMIKKSDHILTPLSDSFTEVVGYQTFIEVLKEIGVKNFNVVLNNINSRKVDFSDILEPLTVEGANVLETRIKTNKRWYEKPLRQGKSVFDSGSKDAVPFGDDIKCLFDELVGV